MYIKVKLLNGIKEPLFYEVPEHWPTIKIGSLVFVPLRNKNEYGFILELHTEKPPVTFAIKSASSLVDFPADPSYFNFLHILSNYHQISFITFIQRIKRFLSIQEDSIEEQAFTAPTMQPKHITLTSEQTAIIDYVSEKITNPVYAPVLIHGVTGSGKTEVYKKLFTQALDEGKSVLFLLPEVTIALQFEKLFKAFFHDKYLIYSFHCATSNKNKKALWENLLLEKPQLIIGVHMPVLLPIYNLGLIIIDEEHETGFQEKKHPKINSKEAAILRAQEYKIPIVLGSATPSVTSLYNTQRKNWKLFSITQRFQGSFPTITHVSLLEKKERKFFWITIELQQAIKKQLEKKEQTIIFINRRGFSFFIQCKACSFVYACPNCSVSLTLHENDTLRCHYCNYTITHPASCEKCSQNDFLKKGIGTQYIAQMLKKIFPHARIARADMDTTVNKHVWQETITDFTAQKIDILVGTQTITKGYDFPGVTLVGIIWADIDLNFPFYNAQETALQKIIQVAGRAGRASHHSSVIIQSMGHHDIFKYGTEILYKEFYEHEIEQRKELLYPPFGRFAEIIIKHVKQDVVNAESTQIYNVMKHAQESLNHDVPEYVTLLGPTEPPVFKIKKIFSKKIYLKSQSFQSILKLYQTINHEKYKSSIQFTPSPLS